MTSRLVAALAAFLLGVMTRAEVAMATEQVPYTVERTLQSGVEIRRYDSTVVAETLIEGGSYSEAGNAGFRRLASYIFGANRGDAKIAMTAPVAMAPDSAQRIAMTAPVDSARDSSGGWRIAFYMPAGYTLESLPQPLDPRVTLRVVPGRWVAALTAAPDGPGVWRLDWNGVAGNGVPTSSGVYMIALERGPYRAGLKRVVR